MVKRIRANHLFAKIKVKKVKLKLNFLRINMKYTFFALLSCVLLFTGCAQKEPTPPPTDAPKIDKDDTLKREQILKKCPLSSQQKRWTRLLRICHSCQQRE